jgi:DNA-binding XRE family transcriptional regulator
LIHGQLTNSLPTHSALPYIARPSIGRALNPAAPVVNRPFQGHFSQTISQPSTQPSPAALPRDISSRFGLRLRELRRSRNLTQLQMAIDFGIDRSFISDVERGRKSISLTFLEVIALGMHVELSELLRDL